MEENKVDTDVLDILIRKFFDKKNVADSCKKEAEQYNQSIKEFMSEMNIDNYTSHDGLQAKIIIQNRDSFNDTKLIAKLKELNVLTPIKTIEVVDMDELENVIYNGKLDAKELTDCKESKQVTTLKVTKKKGE